jgi:hypothetical protein
MPLNISGSIINSLSIKSYSNDRITQRGLILHLDAAIDESYPQSGTTWYDISNRVENVDVLVVAGGGAGGHNGTNNDIAGGGGGAGGLIYKKGYQITNSNAITVTVGNGGSGVSAGSSTAPTNGENSVFGTLTAIGGGRGAGYTTGAPSYYAATAGGSGGGGAYANNGPGTATSGQGNSGGSGTNAAAGGAYAGGGGGGAGAVGGNGYGNGGNGGNGLAYDISGVSTYYAGGGGGGAGYQIAGFNGGTGGLGGGGNASATGIGSPGTANTGGGAGGSGNVSGPPYPGAASANGGSGIVIVRYKGGQKGTGGTITKINGYTVHTFTSSGTFVPYSKQNATLVNGPTFSNGAITLDGTNDWINLPTTGFNLLSLTTEFWFKFNATGTGAYLWCLADASGGNPELRLGFNSANKLSYTWFDSAAYLFDTTSTATLSLNTWYHIVVTTTNNQYIFYINGVVDKSLTGTTYNGGTIAAHSIGTYNLYGTSPGYSGYLNASIGIFRVYNRVLSANEILQNYNIERGRFKV